VARRGSLMGSDVILGWDSRDVKENRDGCSRADCTIGAMWAGLEAASNSASMASMMQRVYVEE
jgi:hypothetical protein